MSKITIYFLFLCTFYPPVFLFRKIANIFRVSLKYYKTAEIEVKFSNNEFKPSRHANAPQKACFLLFCNTEPGWQPSLCDVTVLVLYILYPLSRVSRIIENLYYLTN